MRRTLNPKRAGRREETTCCRSLKPDQTLCDYFSLRIDISERLGKDVDNDDETSRSTPTISEWTQNRDGSITVRVSGSAFDEGEVITTSKVQMDVDNGWLVVTTVSGSR